LSFKESLFSLSSFPNNEAVNDFVIEPIGKIVFTVAGNLFSKSLKP
jgi:hypothetical protein